MTRLRLPRACGVMAGLALVSSAWAEAVSLPIHVEYRGAEGCPNEAAFAARLHERMMGSTGSGIDRPRRVLIAVDGSGDGAVGELTIEGRSGETTTRQISGPSCEQVVDALAFVVALTLDPAASGAAAPAPPSAAPPGDAPAARPPPGATWRLSAAAHASMTGAFPPGLQVSVPVFVELGDESSATLHRWTPAVRAGFERSFGASVQVPEGSARFVWTVGRLDLCASLSVAPQFSVGPCLGADMGAIDSAGSIAHPRQASPFWFALGGIVRGRWRVRSPVFLEVDAGAVVPVTRNAFVFDPDTVLYQVPAVSERVSGGVGAYFW